MTGTTNSMGGPFICETGEFGEGGDVGVVIILVWIKKNKLLYQRHSDTEMGKTSL